MDTCAMTGRAPPPSSSTSEIPDLDLALPSKQRSSKATDATSVRPDAAKASSYGIEGILDDDLLGSNLDVASLDIDVSNSSRSARAGSQTVPTHPWPCGVTPDVGSVAIASSQVEPLCTWGPSPTHWWQTIPYAYFVYQGRHQLLGQVHLISNELKQNHVATNA